MKILYDHQIFTIQEYGGISRYFAQIISNLPEKIQTEIAIKYSNNEYIRNIKLLPTIEKLVNPIEKFIPEIKFKGKRRLFQFVKKFNQEKYVDPSIINKNKAIELLKKQDFDIFHPTYYDDYFLNYIGDKPFVLTIHDMIHELFPEMINDTNLIFRKAKLASQAAHIIAVSEKTKKDIIEILGINEEKISVIYHASSLEKKYNTKSLALPQDYILYVGGRWNYKNFLFFVSAIKSLLDKNNILNLLCTGSSFNAEERKLLQELKLENRFYSSFIEEEQFYEIYHNAKAFIFPSYYEGFGIPIIEAFDSECPVVLSNSSCFPEIAGNAAIYFEPKSKKQLILAIEKVLDDHDFRESLIANGRIRLKAFTWSKSAMQTLDVYKNILSN